MQARGHILTGYSMGVTPGNREEYKALMLSSCDFDPQDD